MFQKFLLACFFIAFAAGDFTASIWFGNFQVQDNALANGAQCDAGSRFGKNCDVMFNFCVEDMKRGDGTFMCNTNWRGTGVVQFNSDNVTMYQNYQYGNWSNPTAYKFSGIYAGIRVKVQAFDYNFGASPNALIDQYVEIVTVPAGVKNNPITVTHYRGPSVQPTKTTFYVTLKCNTGSGANCLGGSTGTPATPPTGPTQPWTTGTPPPCNLNNVMFDIFVIVDYSNNMGMTNYQNVQSYLQNSFLSKFTIGSGNTQIGFFAYGKLAEQTTCAGVCSGSSCLQRVIQQASYSGSNSSFLTGALYDLVPCMQASTGYRSSANHLTILIGPGTASFADPTVPAKSVRQSGMNVVAVGMGSGGVSMSTLQGITGSASNVIQVQNIQHADAWIGGKICRYNSMVQRKFVKSFQ